MAVAIRWLEVEQWTEPYYIFLRVQTFRPKKRFDRGTLKFSLHKQANASLNSGIDLKEVVKLPPGEDVNDWIAVHGKSISVAD